MRSVYLAALVLIPCLRPLIADSEHFEKRVRPLLSQKCYTCHNAKTAMSGLRLDTKAGWQKGGSRGTAIIPGDPEHSLLLRAVSHVDATLRMPPAARLTDAEIGDLAEWIRGGAVDPRTDSTPVATSARTHWSFQPVKTHVVPSTRNRVWPRSFIDSFLLRELEGKGLRPAPAADKRTLLRRITFDLTGLPPTPREVADFLADTSSKAFERVVDRLLASPHYGERWGRHWLDLVRFAETSGHEFDSEKPDAWRYRDYVIRAFNDDVPYDRLIREHIAGDLIANPRYSADGSRLESPLGSAFFGLHEERNAADDLAEVRCEKTDNQIDVLSKTFLGLTVACARCHDHKFDPIPTADYYSLSGILYSTRQAEFQLDSAEVKQKMRTLREQIGVINGQITAAMPRRAQDVASRLLRPDAALTALIEGALKDPTHILYPLAKLRVESTVPFAERLAELRAELKDGASEITKRGDLIFADFRLGDYSGWDVQGPAFGASPSTAIPPNLALSGYRGGGLASSFGSGSNVFTGVLNSKSFVATKRFMHVRLTSTPDRTRRREHGALRFTLQIAGRPAYLNATKEGVFEWQTAGLERQMDLPAFFVIADRAPDGYIAVEKIILSDQRQPPKFDIAPNSRLTAMLEQPLDSLESLSAAYQKLFEDAIADPQPGLETQWILAALQPAKPESIAPLEQQRVELEKQFPAAAYGMLSREDTPVNAHVLARGNPMNRGEEVPHRFLRVLSKHDNSFSKGSGRLELADAIASPTNPLTPRVMVNRVWKHHFGYGLVRSLDNFGAMGERPSHPDLLDTLAAKFIESGFSVKALHRIIVLSAAYRMSSEAGALARQKDPENRLLHSMPVRRLEAESIRDSVLAVSGTLDRTVYGKSVKPFISPYQDGRGKPATGPLDANGRRSVYIEVRRNFLTPLLMAFDFPVPFTTIGNRGTTTVPSQALMMMNNEFVNQQAEKWATRMLREFTDPKERIHGMFVEAYGRPPEAAEIASIDGFLSEQASAHQVDVSHTKPWTDLAHVVFNSKEFIFLR